MQLSLIRSQSAHCCGGVAEKDAASGRILARHSQDGGQCDTGGHGSVLPGIA
jgi:hypothetical protein